MKVVVDMLNRTYVMHFIYLLTNIMKIDNLHLIAKVLTSCCLNIIRRQVYTRFLLLMQ